MYHRVRQEAISLGARGLFFECLPDAPEECDSPTLLQENIARLRFYERFDARPVDGTEYQKPIKPGDRCMPFLVCDSLGRDQPLRREFAQKVVRAVLERKYGDICPPEYIEQVVHLVFARTLCV